jgi:hypothetical protein
VLVVHVAYGPVPNVLAIPTMSHQSNDFDAPRFCRLSAGDDADKNLAALS